MQDIFQDLNTQIRQLLVPKDIFAWQTLLSLSLFSLLVAALLDTVEGSNPFATTLLINLSWIFFAAAVWWGLSETKSLQAYNFSLSPWVTGAVLCLFLFRPWLGDFRLRLAIAVWPVISTGVMALPHFVNWELKFKLPKDKVQKTLIMTLLINLLLSCWITFQFRIQSWVDTYPSLLVRSLDESDFVIDLVTDRKQPSQGVALLEGMINEIKEDIAGQPWYQTERWLYTRKDQLEAALQETLQTLEGPEEQVFWQVEAPAPRQSDQAYLLTLRAIWSGPMAKNGAFDLEKTCKIGPVDAVRPVPRQEDEPPPLTQVTSVDCGEDAPVERFRSLEAT
ncbi:MAG: DUF5357 family protein [Cyanobacteria bacterium P01_F01_bin.3]